MLQITRPIVFLDLETTGVDPAVDRITEIGCVKVSPEGPNFVYESLVNPGRPLSEEVEVLTGITTSMLIGAPTFKSVAEDLHKFLEGCDLGGFGITNFDVPLLWEEFWRAGIEWNLEGVRIVDAGTIFKKREPRTLTAAMRFYCQEFHEGAHRAVADAKAAMKVLGAQAREEGSGTEIEELAKESAFDRRVDLAGKIVLNANDTPVYNFGDKTKGVPVADDLGFARWMISKNFPENTKMVLRRIMDEEARREQELPF